MLIKKSDLYLCALRGSETIAHVLTLSKKERRYLELLSWLWIPGLLYAFYLIEKYYDDYRQRVLTVTETRGRTHVSRDK